MQRESELTLRRLGRAATRRRTSLIAILVVAAALRLWGIADRLPDPTLGISPFDDSVIEETDRTTMGIAWSMWGGGAKPLDLNPHTGGWPGLSFYMTLGVQVLYRGFAGIFLGVTGTDAFIRETSVHPDRFFLFARLFGAALGVLTVWLTYRAANRLVGQTAALIAATVLAVNPLHIGVSQHVSDPNLLALFFTLLAVSSVAYIHSGRGWKASAFGGAMIGLAGASKYVPLLLIAPFVIAHLDPSPSNTPERTLRARNCGIGLLAALAMFAAASPYVLLDHQVAWGEIALQARTLTSDWTGQTNLPLSLPTYLSRILPAILGWPLFVLSVAGLAAFWTRSRSHRVVTLFVFALLVGNGLLRVAQERYLLPMLPFCLMASAFAVDSSWKWLEPRVGLNVARAAIGALIGLVVTQAVLPTIATRSALALPDSRHESRRWLNANIPPDRPLTVELYGPVVNSARTERLAIAWPFFAATPELVRAAYNPIYLDGLQYYVSSSEVTDRFARQPGKYPREEAYYGWLAAQGRKVWSSESVRASGPRIVVLALPTAISERSERDRAWSRDLAAPMDPSRLSTWCWDLSQMFLLAAQDDRVEEWAVRGLSIAPLDRHVAFLRTLAAARLNLGDYPGAEAASVKGLKLQPHDPELHHYRGRALQAVGRDAEAASEYERSLRLAPAQPGAEAIRVEVARIRSELGEGSSLGHGRGHR